MPPMTMESGDRRWPERAPARAEPEVVPQRVGGCMSTEAAVWMIVGSVIFWGGIIYAVAR